MTQTEIWNERYERGCGRLLSTLEGDMPKTMIQNEVRMLLNAVHGGPWKAIAKLIWYEVKSTWETWTFMHFEFVRRRVFRRTPSLALEIAERVVEEERALREMGQELGT